jgi:hypothetical protein
MVKLAKKVTIPSLMDNYTGAYVLA